MVLGKRFSIPDPDPDSTWEGGGTLDLILPRCSFRVWSLARGFSVPVPDPVSAWEGEGNREPDRVADSGA